MCCGGNKMSNTNSLVNFGIYCRLNNCKKNIKTMVT